MKRRRWVWIVGAVLLVVLVCAAAILNPVAPYRFLRGAQLQDIKLLDYSITVSSSASPPVTTVPSSTTSRTYVASEEPETLFDKMRTELTAAGWKENAAHSSDGGPTMVSFSRGTNERIVALPRSQANGPLPDGVKAIIYFSTETTWLDRLQAKLHPKWGGP